MHTQQAPARRGQGRTVVDLMLGIDPAAPLPLHRQLYTGPRSALLEAVARELGGLAEPGPNEAGLYPRLVLAADLDEEDVARRAAELGVAVYPARPYYARPVERAGLILGYAALDEAGIAEGIRRLRLAIDRVRSGG